MQLTFEFKQHPSIPGRIFWSEGSTEPENLRSPVFVPLELLQQTKDKPPRFELDSANYRKIWASLNCAASPTGIGSHLFPDLQSPLQESDKDLPIVRTFLDNLKTRLFLLHIPQAGGPKKEKKQKPQPPPI